MVNIYLASCVTPELRKRMRDDRLVHQDFNLTEVLHDSAKREEFLEYFKHLLHL